MCYSADFASTLLAHPSLSPSDRYDLEQSCVLSSCASQFPQKIPKVKDGVFLSFSGTIRCGKPSQSLNEGVI